MNESELAEMKLLRDENERLRAEIERLRAGSAENDSLESWPSQKQAALLLDHAHVLVRDPQSRIIFWNQGAEQLYGWSQSEAIGQVSHTLLQTVFPESDEAISAALERDGKWVGELLHTCRNGTKVVVASNHILQRDALGAPVAILEINNDITKRKQAEEVLRNMASIVENSGDAIISKTIDGTITSWNRGAEGLYGYSPDEAIGRPITLIIPDEGLNEMDGVFGRLRRGEVVEAYETVRRHKDGRLVHVSVQMSPIWSQDGHILGASAIARDITERKHSEVQMRDLRDQAETRSLTLKAANDVALDILTSQTGDEALRHIADAARQLTQAQYAALGVARPDGQGLSAFVTVGLTPEEEERIGPSPLGKGLLGLLLTRSEPLRVSKLTEHSASAGFPPNHPPMSSFLGVPIRRGETVLGSLYLTNKENAEAFSEPDEIAVQALGAHAAVAIHNWQLLSRHRALLRGIIMGQEEERRAVAYDLHDGLTQYVMASQAHLQTAWSIYGSGGSSERATREMAKGLDYLRHAVVESRRLVNGLRSLTLDEMGLAGALEQLLGEEKTRAGWETQFIHNLEMLRFDVALETTIYRVAQEALNNARKHAQSSRLRITLLLHEDAVTGQGQLLLEVQDWGTGFVIAEKLQQTERVGLQGMAERVNLAGGTYTINSTPGEGTVIRAKFLALARTEE